MENHVGHLWRHWWRAPIHSIAMTLFFGLCFSIFYTLELAEIMTNMKMTIPTKKLGYNAVEWCTKQSVIGRKRHRRDWCHDDDWTRTRTRMRTRDEEKEKEGRVWLAGKETGGLEQSHGVIKRDEMRSGEYRGEWLRRSENTEGHDNGGIGHKELPESASKQELSLSLPEENLLTNLKLEYWSQTGWNTLIW